MVRPGRTLAALAALAVVLGIAGCTDTATPPAATPPAATQPAATPSAASPSPATGSPSATPSAKAAADVPHFDPDGTARDNLEYFDAVNKKLLAAKGRASGRSIIDNLVRAGFDKSAMQVTPDRTPIGNATDSVEFSVRIETECLIGQSSGGSYTSLLAPALDGGSCLVGKTRNIDW
jgi:pyruvate/2-oxoglutarate dehydrogenase complex dihydrolipoamide acyltransferase (E2) component